MDEIFKKINNYKNILNINNQPTKKPKGRHYRPTRPSLINIHNNIKQNISTNKQNFIIEDESSDSNSMIDIHLTNDITLNLPSLKKISEILFDANTIMLIDVIENYPPEAINKEGIGLLIVGLEEWVTEKNILYFLEQAPCFIKQKINGNYTYDNYMENKIKINYIKFFYIKEKFCAFVNMPFIEQIKILGKYFISPYKKIHPTKNSKGETIEFYYAYDLLTLTKSFWYGVILRNLPRDCTSKSIFEFCENTIRNRIKYCLNPIYINNVLCSLVVCQELEYAEILCYKLNNFELVNKKIIKANLHPYICKIRRNTEKYFSFGGEIDNSEISSKHSKSCMELFSEKNSSDNINNDNNLMNNNYVNNNNTNNNDKNNNNNNNIINDNNNYVNNNDNKKNDNNNIKENNNQDNNGKNNNTNEIKNKNGKSKINKSSMEILKKLKNILDLKNKKNLKKIKNKDNENQNINLVESKEIDNDKNILNNDNNSKIELNNRNIKIEQKEDNIYNNKDDIEYYTYNFPDKLFFDNIKKECEYDFFLHKKKVNNSFDEKTISLNESNSFNYSHHKNKNSNNIFNSNSYNSNYYKSNKQYNDEEINYYKDRNCKSYRNEENSNYDFDRDYKERKREIKIYNSNYNNNYKSSFDYYDNESKKSFQSDIYSYYDIEKDKLKNKLKNIDIYKFNKIIKHNIKKESELIYELKCNNTYVKNMKAIDYQMLERNLNINEIDRIINEEKYKMKQYLGKKIYHE